MIFSFFLLLAFLTSWTTFKYSPIETRLPLATYSLAYGITTLIGGTIIGLINYNEVFKLLGPFSIDTTILKGGLDSMKYWALLYTPIILPSLTVLIVTSLFKFQNYTPKFLKEYLPIDPQSFLIIFCIYAGYCLFILHHFGFMSLNFFQKIEYKDAILMRGSIFQNAGSLFFGILYVGLPALSQISLYQIFTTRNWQWVFIFILSFITICILTLLTIQKAPIMVYLLSIILGLYFLKKISIKSIFLGCITMIGLVTLYQIHFYHHWNVFGTLKLIIFRVACNFPFYVKIFPDYIPYLGIDFGQGKLGLQYVPNDTAIVFDFMYPTISWVQGNCAISAHMSSYTQYGVPYALFTLIIIGFFISALSILSKYVRGPISFCLFTQGLISLYYLTQISLRTSIVSCYGYCWVIFSIFLLVLLNIFRNKSRYFLYRKISDCEIKS